MTVFNTYMSKFCYVIFANSMNSSIYPSLKAGKPTNMYPFPLKRGREKGRERETEQGTQTNPDHSTILSLLILSHFRLRIYRWRGRDYRCNI